MEWLAVSIVVVGATYFAIHYRGFRRGLLFMLLGIAVLAAIGGVVGYFYDQRQDEKRRMARQLIKPDQLEISDAILSIGTLSEVKAVITNKSSFHLKELALRVTVVDCPTNFFDKFDPPSASGYEPVKKAEPGAGKSVGKCTAVGEYVAREYGLNIPSGQKRAFNGYVRFENLPPLKPNEWSWYYSVVEIVAE